MKFKSIISVASFFMLLALQSCEYKEECEPYEPENTYYKIYEGTKSKIPFTGTDTLVYISTDGDTAILVGQGKKNYTEKVAVRVSSNPACPMYDYDFFEHLEFSYIGNTLGLSRIFIDINAILHPFNFSEADVDIGSSHFESALETISHPNNYTEEVVINSNSIPGMKITLDSDNYYIYNYQYGILQIVSSGKSWKLNI